MPYIYIGQEAVYHGRPLFRLLCNLKNFGKGRVVYRQSEYEKHPDKGRKGADKGGQAESIELSW